MHSKAAPDAAALAAAVDGVVASLSAGSVRDLSHDQLSSMVGELRRQQARLTSALLAVVGEVDARGSHVHDGALTAAAWVRMHTRCSPHEATALVRTAREVNRVELSATRSALAAGDIDLAHVEAIARGVAGAPAGAVALIEPEALAVARQADPRSVAGVMRQFSHALDPDSADEAALRRHERRGLTIVPTLDGSFALAGSADEVSGAVIATAVDAAGPLVAGDKRTAAQRRLDGLVTICQRWLASPDAPGGARPAQVLVVMDQHTAASGAGDEGSPGATLSWSGPVGSSTARRVACDAEVTTVRIGGDGEVVETGTERRFFTRAQRRAMVARDGDRCSVPFCDRPVAWSHGHHIVPVSRGGTTTVGNGMLPCEGHHVLLHEGHWDVERLPDGRYLLRHRSGRVIGPEPHPPGHSRPPPRLRE